MNIIATVVLTGIIITGLFYIFFRLKMPYYRVDRARMVKVLEMVLTGQATENDWYITFGMIIRHSPELEHWRQQCADIEEEHFIGDQRPPYLFTREGLSLLEDILNDIKRTPL